MKRFVLVLFLLPLVLASTRLTAGWIKTYEGGQGFCVRQTSDGGYIILASRPQGNVLLIKTDAQGDVLWTRKHGSWSTGYSLSLSSDGGFIITGDIFGGPSDDDFVLWLLKTDSDGDSVWAKTYGGLEYTCDWNTGFSVEQTSDGGYIITGKVEDPGFPVAKLWLLKTNAEGDTIWTRSYGEIYGNMNAQGRCVQETSDGGYIIVGTDNYSDGKIWILKTDDMGDTLWTKKYGDGVMNVGYSVSHRSDSIYVVAGEILYDLGTPGAGNLCLLKLDKYGDTLWIKRYGNEGRNCGYCLQQTVDGGYIVTGIKDYGIGKKGKLWLLKTDTEGDTLWTRIYESENQSHDKGYWVEQTPDGGYIVAGAQGHGTVWLLKTDSLGLLAIKDEPAADVTPSWEVESPIGRWILLRYLDHPEGFHASVFNAAGQKVDELYSTLPSGTITWPVTPVTPVTHQGFSSGVYFIREASGNLSVTRKVILVR